MIARLAADIRKLQADVKKLQPVTAPGILTERTTNGVIRRPIRSGGNQGNSAKQVPRWG